MSTLNTALKPSKETNLTKPVADKPKIIATPAVKPSFKIPAPRLTQAQYARNEWRITIPHGISDKVLDDPAAFSLIADKLRPFDTIEAVCEDGSWWGRYLVTGVDRTWAKLRELEWFDLRGDLERMPSTEDQNYDITYNTIGRFQVVRKKDRAIIKDNFITKLDAQVWLQGHLKSLAS